jgi:hypothetical protein
MHWKKRLAFALSNRRRFEFIRHLGAGAILQVTRRSQLVAARAAAENVEVEEIVKDLQAKVRQIL